jgi:type IV secretory pathway VirB2 component (pilin)
MRNRSRLATYTLLASALVVLLAASNAFAAVIPGVQLAAAGPMPWDRVLGVIVSALTGTTAKLVAILGIIICAVIWATGEGHTGRLFKTAIGISLLVGAGNLVNLFFQGGSGGVV